MENNHNDMTAVEKFTSNVIIAAIARLAMIATPILLGFFAWAALTLWNQMDDRIAVLEAKAVATAVVTQDHEHRLVTGKQAREDFQKLAAEQIRETNASLRELSTQMVVVNGNLIRLQTIIENRLPASPQ